MTRLTTSLTTAAVALVMAAQALIAPASCCLLRAVLSGGSACCHAAAASEAGPRTCCHGRAAKPAESVSGYGVPTPSSGECLVCSAGAKVVSNDRVAIPDLEAGQPFLSAVAVEPVTTAPGSVAFVADEPFHRTAPAMCAWLCVWRK